MAGFRRSAAQGGDLLPAVRFWPQRSDVLEEILKEEEASRSAAEGGDLLRSVAGLELGLDLEAWPGLGPSLV